MSKLKPLNTGIAAVIGINKYANGIPELKSAVNDAKALAKLLKKTYNYQVLLLLDEEASLTKINQLLASLKQGKIPLKNQTLDLAENDRFFFYFAGHGIALDGLDSADGPQGFLVPQDGKLNLGTKEKNLLAMTDLHDALIALPCRHLLVTLDCCFGGSLRWAGLNRDLVPSQKLYRERYQRFTNSKAQQVITSAAYDEKALDSISRFSQRGEIGGHSPFAEALLKGLAGEADFSKDGAITATELYAYLQSKLGEQKLKQTPSNFQLKNHDKGEYIFPVPNFNPAKLETAPPIDEAGNPYQSLASFDEIHRGLFFGRERVVRGLYRAFNDNKKTGLTAVLGASGSGKSSLVKAGLLPRLREDGWYIVNPFRPGRSPVSALAAAILLTQKKEADRDAIKLLENELRRSPKKLTDLAGDKLLLVIDQFEELVTECPTEEKDKFLEFLEDILRDNSGKARVIITLRSDFQAQFTGKLFEEKEGRFLVPMMTQDEYREVIEKPALEKVLYFDPPGLVDELVNEVVQMPGALPLLSFTLSQLYFRCCDRWQRGEKNRALTLEDYQKLGGVTGALKTKATDVFNQLIKEKKATEQTIRDVILRMVSVSGDELARRRVPEWELVYPKGKNKEVEEIVKAFVDARLLVKGNASDGQPYVEPAHDALANGWDKIAVWKSQKQQDMLLRGRLTPAAREWQQQQRKEFLWDADPYLDVLGQVLRSEDNWFNAVEEEFVKESIGRKSWKKRVRWAMTAGVIIVLGGLATIAEFQRRDAVRQSEIALARQLLAEYGNAASRGLYQDAALLAVESMKKFQTQNEPLLEADRALRSRLTSLPDFVWGTNHNAPVNAVAFSADGKYVATASDDRTAGVWDVSTGKEVARLNHDDRVNAVAFSNDGKYVGTASADNTARVWEASTGKEVARLDGDGEVWAVAFSGDGKYVATAGDNNARVWEPSTAQLIAEIHEGSQVIDIAFSGDSKFVATASPDNTARVWEPSTGKEVAKVRHNNVLNAVAFSADSKYIATGSSDGTARVWEASTGKELAELDRDGEVRDVAFSADGKYLATASSGQTAWVWDVNAKKEITRVNHDGEVNAVAFSSDGKYLATASADNTAGVWDAATGKEVARLGHDGNVTDVAFSRDGKYVATASADNTGGIWDASTGEQIARLNRDKTVNVVALSDDGKYVATSSYETPARVWDATTGKEVAQLKQSFTNAMGFSSGGKFVATAGCDNTPRVFDASTGQEVAKFEQDTCVNSVALSADGKYLVTLDVNSIARVFDASTGKEVAKFERGQINAVALSADGKYVATASWDNTARVWEAATGKEVALLNHDDGVNFVAFSADGKYVATASWDNTAGVWSAATGERVAKLYHDAPVNFVAFSDDGKYVATASYDKTAGVWSAATGDEVAKLNHDAPVNSVAFSADGKYVATASADNTARVWEFGTDKEVVRIQHDREVKAVVFSADSQYAVTVTVNNAVRVHFLKPDALISEACRHLRRNLTADEWKRYMNTDLHQYEKTCDGLPVHRSLLAEARKLVEEDKVKEAEKLLGALLKLDDKIDLLPNTGTIEQNPRAVVPQFQAEGKVSDGVRRAREGKVEEAIALFQEAVELQPNIDLNPGTKEIENDPETVARSFPAKSKVSDGVRLAREGKVEEATRLFQEAQELKSDIDLNPDTKEIENDPEAVARWQAARRKVWKAVELRYKGKVEEAIAQLKEAQKLEPGIDLDPQTEEIENDLEAVAQRFAASGKVLEGVQLAGEGNVEGATRLFLEAQELQPDIDLNPWLERKQIKPEKVARRLAAQGKVLEGVQLAENGKVEEAIALFQEAVELQPDIDLNPYTKEIENDPEAVAKELAPKE